MRRGGRLIAACVGAALFGPAFGAPGATEAAATPAAAAAVIEQGRYLASAGDCISCHTQPRHAPYSGGRALSTPFGVIYSANITPDTATGIGAWSEQQFARALRQGVDADGRHLYPAFPYTAYTLLSDEDVHALYLYLRALPPVRYTPPSNALAFPLGYRALLAGWKLLYFRDGRYSADRGHSAEWNRGAYLTQALGHCGACHTPRNVLGGERTALALTGGTYLDDIADEVVDDVVTPMDERTVRPWSAANLTPAASGLGAWSLEDIVAYLKTGHSARAGAFGPMSEVVANSTARLTDADLRSIGVYLKSLPPAAQGPPAPPREALRLSGEVVYTARCGDCHLATGQGVPRVGNAVPSKTAPPLAGNAALQSPDPATLINVVLYGAHEADASARAWPRMSGFELSVGLDDEAIAALCTYVRSSWGNQAGPVDAAAVARQH